MNKIYRLVWNAAVRAWAVASELAGGRRKGSGGQGGRVRWRTLNGVVVCASLGLASFPALAGGWIGTTALPTGGTVTAGAASISRSGNTLTVNQSSQNLSLNWTGFNIGTQGTVDFIQPSSSSIAVNRIGGNNGSQILGNLDANGQVYLINPNGILFGRNAQVNVGGIVASTLDISDSQLGSGSLDFSGSGTGSIINQGHITANGGLVALIGNQVINQGVISAELGSVALAGGSAVTLTFSGDQLVGVQVDQSTLNNLAANGQLIQADGGRVWMTAGAADSLLASAVNNSGVVEARTFESHEGTITLLSGMDAGTTLVSGTLDASAPNGGNGGNIDTSGGTVKVANGSAVTTLAPQGETGNWLIDPQDYTIAPSGGDETGAQLSSALDSSNITIESSSGAMGGSGNINVDDTVSWNAATTLTLDAADNVNVNGLITVGSTSSSAGLIVNTAYANGRDAAVAGGTINVGLNLSGFTGQLNLSSSNTLIINNNPYTIITSAGALQALSSVPSGYYALGRNIDAGSISNFTPIAAFSGVFDGLGHTIGNLSVSAADGGGGLFGTLASSSVVRNLGLTGSVSSTGSPTDGLATTTSGTISNVAVSMTVSNAEISGTNSGTIDNAYVSGTVTPTASGSNFGGNYNGGLVGTNNGTISNSFATTTVGGGAINDGGLVGDNGVTGTISNSTANGSISGGLANGGLVGQNQGTISNSSATGAVAAGANNVDDGGLVGDNYGTISNSFATGSVNGGANESGGLVGQNSASGTISNSFATGSVTGVSGSRNGGLVGFNSGAVGNAYATGSVSGVIAGGLVGDNYGAISNAYATGAVTGTTYVGGLAGDNLGTIISGYFDTTTTGISASNGVGSSANASGVTGLTTRQWLTQGPIATQASGWGTGSVWVQGYPYPVLNTMPYVLVTGTGATQVYGSTLTAPTGYTSVDRNGNDASGLLSGTVSWISSSTDTSNASTAANGNPTYVLGGSGLTASGHQVTYDGTLSITPATLIETATAASSTYGSTPSGLTGTITGWVNGQSTASNTSGNWNTTATATSNVGSYAVDGNLTLTAAAAGNYTVVQAVSNNTALTVDPATLTEIATAATSTYGSTPSGLTGTVTGWVNGQSTASNASGLAWTTPATATSNVGSYAIDGNLSLTGAAAGNYTVVQAVSNSTALTIDPGALMQSEQSYISGVAINGVGIVPSQAAPEPTIAPVQIAAVSAASASGNAAGPQVNMTQAIAGDGTLVVVDNGVNLSGVPQSSATPSPWSGMSCPAP